MKQKPGRLQKEKPIPIPYREPEFKSVIEHPLTYKRSIKNVKILDREGSAIVHFFHQCMNTGEKPIPKIVHNMHHDGDLKTCHVSVNGSVVTPSMEKFIERRVDGKETAISLGHRLKVTINIEEQKILPKQWFAYDIRLDYDKVYKNMFKPHVEFSSFHVMMPTDTLKMVITTPENTIFRRDDVEVIVKGYYEIEDFEEEKRCKYEFPPLFLHDDYLFWEIEKPKLACTYFLYFSLDLISRK